MIAELAQCVRALPRALKDEHPKLLTPLTMRREQIVDMLVAEKTQLHRGTTIESQEHYRLYPLTGEASEGSQ